jgi:MFS family permease
VIFGLIAVSAASGRLEIWTLLALVLLAGVCEVVFDNAAQTFLPEIVPEALLPTANGRLYAAEVVTNVFLGLPLGAWLFVVAVGVPFTVDAASFAIAALLVASIRVPRRERTPSAPGATSFVTELAEGLRWLWTNRLLRTLAIMLGLTNLAFNIGQAIFVVFATEELGVSDAGYGVLLAVMSIGAVVGGLMGDRILRRLGTSAALIGSYSVFVVGELGVGLAPTVWLVAVIAIVEALAGIVWNIITVSLRQQIVPNDLLGRVNSVYRWIGWGTIPIGALIGGMVAHSVSLRAPFILGSIVSGLGLLYGVKELVPWRIDAALQRGPLAGLAALSLRPRS